MEGAMAHDLKSGGERTSDVAAAAKSFEQLNLKPLLQSGLKENHFLTPTKIQAAAIPMALAGMDLLVQSKSGTGKTLIYVLAALNMVDKRLVKPQVLVIVPTRELAIQVEDTANGLALNLYPRKDFLAVSFIGGTDVQKDRMRMSHGRIVVGTPGRLLHLMQNKVFDTSRIKLIVLDEADQLYATESQRKSMQALIGPMHPRAQMIACSATYPDKLDEELAKLMRKPLLVSNSERATVLLGIRQFVYELPEELNSMLDMLAKVAAVQKIFCQLSYQQCILFANSQSRADSFRNYFKVNDIECRLMSAAMEQRKRLETFQAYRQFTLRTVVATDLMARGVDSVHANLIINLDPPNDLVTYLHRIGRAGRFGSKGISITFVSSSKQRQNFKRLISEAGTGMSVLQFPTEKPNCFDFWNFDSYDFPFFKKEEACEQEEYELKRITQRWTTTAAESTPPKDKNDNNGHKIVSEDFLQLLNTLDETANLAAQGNQEQYAQNLKVVQNTMSSLIQNITQSIPEQVFKEANQAVQTQLAEEVPMNVAASKELNSAEEQQIIQKDIKKSLENPPKEVIKNESEPQIAKDLPMNIDATKKETEIVQMSTDATKEVAIEVPIYNVATKLANLEEMPNIIEKDVIKSFETATEVVKDAGQIVQPEPQIPEQSPMNVEANKTHSAEEPQPDSITAKITIDEKGNVKPNEFKNELQLTAEQNEKQLDLQESTVDPMEPSPSTDIPAAAPNSINTKTYCMIAPIELSSTTLHPQGISNTVDDASSIISDSMENDYDSDASYSSYYTKRDANLIWRYGLLQRRLKKKRKCIARRRNTINKSKNIIYQSVMKKEQDTGLPGSKGWQDEEPQFKLKSGNKQPDCELKMHSCSFLIWRETVGVRILQKFVDLPQLQQRLLNYIKCKNLNIEQSIKFANQLFGTMQKLYYVDHGKSKQMQRKCILPKMPTQVKYNIIKKFLNQVSCPEQVEKIEDKGNEQNKPLNKLSVHINQQLNILPLIAAAEADANDNDDEVYSNGSSRGSSLLVPDHLVMDDSEIDSEDDESLEPYSSSGFVESTESASSGIETSQYGSSSSRGLGSDDFDENEDDDDEDIVILDEQIHYANERDELQSSNNDRDTSSVGTLTHESDSENEDSPTETEEDEQKEDSEEEEVGSNGSNANNEAGTALIAAQARWKMTFQMQYQFIANYVNNYMAMIPALWKRNS